MNALYVPDYFHQTVNMSHFLLGVVDCQTVWLLQENSVGMAKHAWAQSIYQGPL